MTPSRLATILRKIRTAPDQVRETSEFQPAFQEVAKQMGWRSFHARDVKRALAIGPGDEKPVILDTWLTKGTRAMWVELKAEGGKMSRAQVAEGMRLTRAGIEWHCFRPSEWDRRVVPCLMARERWREVA